MIHTRVTHDVTCDTPGCPATLTDVDDGTDLAAVGWTVRFATDHDPHHFTGALIHHCPSETPRR